MTFTHRFLIYPHMLIVCDMAQPPLSEKSKVLSPYLTAPPPNLLMTISGLLPKVTAVDGQGRTAVFSVSRGNSEGGYLLNENAIENGRISEDAGCSGFNSTIIAYPVPNLL